MLRLAERVQSLNNLQPYHPDRVSLGEVFRSMLTHPNSSGASADNVSNPTPPLPPFPLDLDDISLNTDALMSPIKRTSTPEDNEAPHPERQHPVPSAQNVEEQSTVEVVPAPATTIQQIASDAPTVVSLLQHLGEDVHRCGDILERVAVSQENFSRCE